jgi:hypothetical protein
MNKKTKINTCKTENEQEYLKKMHAIKPLSAAQESTSFAL